MLRIASDYMGRSNNMRLCGTDPFPNAAGTYVLCTCDNIGQIKAATSSVSSENRGYFYDAAWNLNRRTNNGATGTFTVDNKNQLTNAPSPVNGLTYDNNGNLTTSAGGRYEYAYDDENQLVQRLDNGSGIFHPPKL